MVRFLSIFLFFFLIPFSLLGQQAISEYPVAQQQALSSFLSKNPVYQFMPETYFDQKVLKAAREEWGFGKNFKPYYQEGDFNRDGKLDFAVLLFSKENGAKPRGNLYIVVFNGTGKNSYEKAHLEKDLFSNVLFLGKTKEKLFVGAMETDSAGCFMPKGNTYVVQPCGAGND